MAKNVQCCYCQNLGIRFNDEHEPYDWCDKVVDSPDALANRDCDYFTENKTVRTKCPICGGEMWWFGGNHACKECHFIEPSRNMTYSDLTDYLATAIKRCKPMKTNADRIRAMSDEELAKWMANTIFPECPCCPADCDGWDGKCPDNPEKLLVWAKSPAEEGEG